MSIFNTVADLIDELRLICVKHFFSLVKQQTPKEWNNGAKGNILLLPGIHQKWPFMELLGSAINRAGYRIYYCQNLQNCTLGVEPSAKIIEEFLKENNLKDVVIVAHSKGGLIAKHLLHFSREKWRIKQVITLATPYKGSLLAYCSPSAWEMIPGSSLIKKLLNGEHGCEKVIAFYPRLDNMVVPNINLIDPKLKSIQVDSIGHTRLLDDKEVWEMIKKNLVD